MHRRRISREALACVLSLAPYLTSLVRERRDAITSVEGAREIRRTLAPNLLLLSLCFSRVALAREKRRDSALEFSRELCIRRRRSLAQEALTHLSSLALRDAESLAREKRRDAALLFSRELMRRISRAREEKRREEKRREEKRREEKRSESARENASLLSRER